MVLDFGQLLLSQDDGAEALAGKVIALLLQPVGALRLKPRNHHGLCSLEGREEERRKKETKKERLETKKGELLQISPVGDDAKTAEEWKDREDQKLLRAIVKKTPALSTSTYWSACLATGVLICRNLFFFFPSVSLTFSSVLSTRHGYRKIAESEREKEREVWTRRLCRGKAKERESAGAPPPCFCMEREGFVKDDCRARTGSLEKKAEKRFRFEGYVNAGGPTTGTSEDSLVRLETSQRSMDIKTVYIHQRETCQRRERDRRTEGKKANFPRSFLSVK